MQLGSDPTNPFSWYEWPNKTQMAAMNIEIYADTCNYIKSNYYTNQMKVVVISPLPTEEVVSMIDNTIGKIDENKGEVNEIDNPFQGEYKGNMHRYNTQMN